MNYTTWIVFVWMLKSKFTNEYTSNAEETKWQVLNNYRLYFEYMGWHITLNCNEDIYNNLEQWTNYLLPIGQKAFSYVDKETEKLSFWISSYVVNKWIINLDKDERVFIDISKKELPEKKS